jgi:replicative DNA helicase
MPSDLRDSGCLTAQMRILCADNGSEVTIGELMRNGERPLVWSLDERKRMVTQPMTNVLPNGRNEVFTLRLASGRETEAAANASFLTLDGWTPLSAVKVGDRLAVPRRVPAPIQTDRMADEEVILLAHMIGDGSCVKRQPIRYASIDEQSLAAVTKAARHFGITAVRAVRSAECGLNVGFDQFDQAL